MEVGLFIQTQLLHMTFESFWSKIKKQSVRFYQIQIVCSIQIMKGEGYQFETQHK